MDKKLEEECAALLGQAVFLPEAERASYMAALQYLRNDQLEELRTFLEQRVTSFQDHLTQQQERENLLMHEIEAEMHLLQKGIEQESLLLSENDASSLLHTL